jgi:hypothetical protein
VRNLAKILDPDGLWKVVAGEFNLEVDEVRSLGRQEMSHDGSATCSLLMRLKETPVFQLLEVLKSSSRLLQARTVVEDYMASPVAGWHTYIVLHACMT